MILYSLVIPCFNESKNIVLLLDRLNKNISCERYEIIIVNNGSTDDTKKLLNKIKDKYYFLEIVEIEKNEGYGNGIVKGLRKAKGDIVGWTHADLQTDPVEVLRGFKLFEKSENPKNLFIKGSRKKRKISENFFTVGMALLSSIFLKYFLWDINAQPNLFHKDFLNKLENMPKDFSLDLYFLIMAKKFKLKIIRLPIIFAPRKFGKSSWNNSLKSKLLFIKRNLNYISKISSSK